LIGLDTNVLVRYLTQDDPKQSELVNRLFLRKLSTSQQGFISLLVIAEVCWVLKAAYDASETELAALLESLLATPQFYIEHRDCVDQALKTSKKARNAKAGLVDFLINGVAHKQGCEYCVTFDKAAARSTGMRMLDVSFFA
jgi:predicted nucleic-acid-binding protein